MSTTDRLDIFDKKTRDVIKSDMIKMRGRSRVSVEQTITKIERKMENMSTRNDELFALLNQMRAPPPPPPPLDRYQHQQETPANLMNLQDDDHSDIEYPNEEYPDNDTFSSAQSQSFNIRQRQPEGAWIRRNDQPTLHRAPPADTEANDINASYILYRCLLLIFLIFVVPFITSYFNQ